eukprot:TRINITY_DN9329_c0_g2_i2.p1 TRINITY_DN9329_c0_g2~~TRINITY_DN9329_c0_g2_i2.p1  ORF type:complete len:264 (-),score=84.20 TRINITY_DN9329_c0_g2_i2:43-834(-)
MKYADIIVPGEKYNETTISFIKTNLEQKISIASKLEGKTSHIFSGDLLSNMWIRGGGPEAFRSNQMIFCQSVPIKQEFYNLLTLFESDFSIELYHLVIKRFFKATVRMLATEMHKRRLGFDDLELFNILEENVEIEEEEKLNSKKPCKVLFVIFLYEKYANILRRNLEKLIQAQPTNKFYVLNLFSNMEYVSKIAELSENISVINILMTADVQTFETQLRERCLKKEVNLLQEKQYHQRLNKSFAKYLKRRLEKLKKEEIHFS